MSPRRIVIATWGSLGDLHPYLAVALSLAARGHRVTIATSVVHQPKIEREGLGFALLGPHIPVTATDLIRRSMDRFQGSEFLIREILFPYLSDAYAEALRAIEGADLVLTHSVAFGAQLAAEKTGIRWLSAVLAPVSFFSAYDPPVASAFPSLARMYPLGIRVGEAVVGLGRCVTERWLEPVRRVRAGLGLRKESNPLFEGQFSPQGTLALFSRHFAAPQPDWPVTVHITGFPFYDREQPGMASPALEEFFASGDPPIVFVLGSAAVFVAGDFYRQGVDAAVRLGRRALVVVGDPELSRLPQPLPPGVAVAAYARYSEIFPRAAVNVHQGGIGTTAQALRAGRPMLVVPYAHDQPDNAHRVQRLGAGRVLYRWRFRALSAARQITTLLDDLAYAGAAARIGGQIRSEDGAENAASAVETALTG